MRICTHVEILTGDRGSGESLFFFHISDTTGVVCWHSSGFFLALSLSLGKNPYFHCFWGF